MAAGGGRLVSAVVSRLATRYVSLFAIHFLLRLLNEKNRTLSSDVQFSSAAGIFQGLSCSK